MHPMPEKRKPINRTYELPVLLSLLPLLVYAQVGRDTVSLNDGRTLIGTIVGERENDYAELRLLNGILAEIPSHPIAYLKRSGQEDGEGRKNIVPTTPKPPLPERKAPYSARIYPVSATTPIHRVLPDVSAGQPDYLPLASNPDALKRPVFVTPYVELGICLFDPDLGELNLLLENSTYLVQYQIAVLFPFVDGMYVLAGQISAGLYIVGASAFFRYRFSSENPPFQVFIAAGLKGSFYTYSGSSSTGSVHIGLSSTYPVLQIGMALVHDLFALVVEFPLKFTDQTTMFEGRQYTASPSGPAVGLTIAL